MYQTGHTIEKTLDQIHRHDLVLPAIQREFVWRPEQIGRLFDSLMQGYPFGTFLYWQVGAENSGEFKFYDFVLWRSWTTSSRAKTGSRICNFCMARRTSRSAPRCLPSGSPSSTRTIEPDKGTSATTSWKTYPIR